MAPIVNQKKGEFKTLFASLLKEGFIRAKIDNKNTLLTKNLKLVKNKKHNIDVIIDRLILEKNI